jgi:hypothetical protein
MDKRGFILLGSIIKRKSFNYIGGYIKPFEGIYPEDL